MKIASAALFLTLMSSELVVSQSTSNSELAKIEQEWCNALKAGDAHWFEDHLADDFTSVSSADGSLHRKHDEIAGMQSSAAVYESLELSDLTERVEGNAGVVTGVNHIKGHDKDGNVFDVKLAFTDTYLLRDGRWLVWASQHTRVK
jgi:ketosteroid isomerase-like protein